MGLVAIGLVGLGVRSLPAVLAADPPVGVAPTVNTEAAPLPTSIPTPTPSTRSSSGKDQRANATSKKKRAAAKVTVPATGPGTYRHSRANVEPATSSGRLVRYDLRIEKGLNLDAEKTALLIESVLNDKRSWRGTGRWRFELVAAGQLADLHAYIVTPGTTNRLCAPLRTRGEVSCQNGNKVVLNAKRWVRGASSYGDDRTGYRRYLVNHEFGHALGHDHVSCPGRGRSAPVMMQQTKGLDGCRKNPWPRTNSD